MTPARQQAAEFHDRAVSGQDTDDQRYRLFISAVGVDPDFARGWFTLGHKLGEMGLLAASLAAYRRALECPVDGEPGSRDATMTAQCWCSIALRQHHLGDPDAEESALRCVALDPEMAFGYTNLAMIYSRQGRHDEAITAARKAWKLGPEKPENELGLGFALMFGGHYAEGLERFEARFDYKLTGYKSWPYPKWDGANTGTLIVVSEQGFGDAVSMARFIPAAAQRVKRLLFVVQPELVKLLGKALVSIAPNVQVLPYLKDFPQADAWTAVGSLPTSLGLTDEEIRDATGLPVPRLHAPFGWALPGRRFRIGIAWAGSAANDIDKWRSLPSPEPFLALYRVPGVELYSFQFGKPAEALHTGGSVSLIKDLQPWIKDAADSAAILTQMDLVVTVESFLGHLAGFMGVPCWVLYSKNGQDWRLGSNAEAVLWYERHQIFQQGSDAAWGPVFERVIAALSETVALKGYNDVRSAAD